MTKLLMISGDRSLARGKRGAFLEMLKEFHTHFDRIDIICPTSGMNDVVNVFENVFVHPSPWNLLWQPKWITKKGQELIKEHHHDVMTVHDFPPFYNGLGSGFLKRKTGIPTCVEIHHIVGFPKPASLSEWVGKIMSWLFLGMDCKQFDAVRTVNKTVKDQLTAWGVPQKNISTVPSFYLDHDALTPDPTIKKEYGVCFAGRLVAHKGLSDVIEAVTKLPACRLLIVGDGPMRNAAEVHVRDLGADNFITFTGWLDTYEDVVRAMQSAKIFVMNSLSEGGPRVALEAMALGIPVISTRVGIMPDIIQDGVNGLLSNGTSTDLAVKMQRLLGDSSFAAKIGTEGRKTVLQHFEKKALIKNYADFLKNLVHLHHS